MPSPRFSLVIPAYNEETYLPRLLDTVDEAAAHYAGGADAIEVIVSDNNSKDKTGEIARSRGCKTALVEKRCIASVRNGGAALAQGEILCFVDADMRIHPETFNAIDDALATGKVVAGATGVRVERMSLGIAMTHMVIIPVVWITRIDTGVVFCRRTDFEAVGGYNEDLSVAEDVRFLLDLRKLGRTRGQRLARVTSAKALSSARKWDEHGEWHYFKLIFHIFFTQVFARKRYGAFIGRYWYGDQRKRPDEKHPPRK